MANRFTGRMSRVLEVHGRTHDRTSRFEREAQEVHDADVAMQVEIASYEREAKLLLEALQIGSHERVVRDTPGGWRT